MVKTTVEIPEPLWRRAKIRALDEKTDFRAIVLRGLELALAEKPKKGA